MSAPVIGVDVEGAIGGLTIELRLEVSVPPTVIVGPNGAGKTSALMMILGAITPRRGRVVVNGAVVFDHESGIDVPIEHRQIGYLPQRYALFPHLDVLGNVVYGIQDQPRAVRIQRWRRWCRSRGTERSSRMESGAGRACRTTGRGVKRV